MEDRKLLNYIKSVLDNMPDDWLKLTTHRLDIYNEKQAKTQFLEQFEELYKEGNVTTEALAGLPTAYDYIRLGHPLSCILEWTIAKLNNVDADQVISFSSGSIPVMSVLRKNLLDEKGTRLLYAKELPDYFNIDALKTVYGYQFELEKIEKGGEMKSFDGSTIIINESNNLSEFDVISDVDFSVTLYEGLGSVLIAYDHGYISDIQHVRRRETVAMTPANCLLALKSMTEHVAYQVHSDGKSNHKEEVKTLLKEITNTDVEPVVASSGLSMQYAIMMGLIDDALESYPGKSIKIVVPPNAYGGTNDQARRVAACIDNVDVVDLPVDGDNDMVQSVDTVLTEIANQDAVPYIIAEIPTNPRVEVPDLDQLKEALIKKRKTLSGKEAIDPVFILDQTFCPNVHFVGDDGILSSVRTISYASGSKFPSGGRCTAGYCVGNSKTRNLMGKIEKHLSLCDNEATDLQYEILAEQLPSMNQRIEDAYKNTRAFVDFIQETLPEAKINFVSNELAAEGFTPSVFSMDLPTQGDTEQEREDYKRALNLKLINMMITRIPDESKYCVSYGQLKGCYWTIPATSTQGTTKEGDKDYIVRVSLSPQLDLELHEKVFSDFVNEM